LGEHVRIDPRVGAGDEQGERLLAVDQSLKESLLRAENVFLKLVDAIYEFLHGFLDVGAARRLAGSGAKVQRRNASRSIEVAAAVAVNREAP
jgi:hypothetical protein